MEERTQGPTVTSFNLCLVNKERKYVALTIDTDTVSIYV